MGVTQKWRWMTLFGWRPGSPPKRAQASPGSTQGRPRSPQERPTLIFRTTKDYGSRVQFAQDRSRPGPLSPRTTKDHDTMVEIAPRRPTPKLESYPLSVILVISRNAFEPLYVRYFDVFLLMLFCVFHLASTTPPRRPTTPAPVAPMVTCTDSPFAPFLPTIVSLPLSLRSPQAAPQA